MRQVLIVLASLTLGLTACSSGAETSGVASNCVDLTGEGSAFTIQMVNLQFVPECFSASASQAFTLINEDEVAHTFTLEKVGVPVRLIDVTVDARETFNGEALSSVVEPGTYQIFCRFHLLMAGRATVVT